MQPLGTKSSGTTLLPLTEEKIQYKMEKPFTPVLGLWGIFFNAVPCLLSAGSAGGLAILWPQPSPGPHHSEPPPTHE